MNDYGLPSWMQEGLRKREPLLEPGTRIGRRYRIDGHLGSGGFGVVYAAVDRKLDRRVALKFMATGHLRGLATGERRDYAKAFAREARITAQLPHPSIVVVHDVKTARRFYRGGEALDTKWRGTPFVVMELLEGETLHARLRDGALPVDEALALLDGVCQGVAFAHDSGVVHCDLKPANVFVCGDGRMKVLDFGIAMADHRACEGSDHHTAIGTHGYMAPERLEGVQPDARVDVFALGVIAYEMLCGERPMSPEPKHLRLRARIREVPPALDDLVERCLSVAPEERPESASTVLAELRRITAAHKGVLGPVDLDRHGPTDPFPGLAAFRENQSLFFFGRSREIRDLIARMGPTRRWLSVEGASGVGKSSLVRAGLLPAVRCGWVADGPTHWRTAVLRPGGDPAGALVRALGTKTDNPILEVVEALNSDEGLLIVVDQFEEVLRESESPSVRTLDRWLALALSIDASVYVVTTMRSDFAPQLDALASLGPLLNKVASRYQLLALRGAALRQAIVGPAALTGTTWATQVADRIISEAGDEPGSLPLVSHVLRTLWLDCGGSTISEEDYDRVGGLAGALARTATAALDALDDDGRTRARALVLALVVSGRDQPDARRTISYSRAIEAAGSGAKAERVLASLVDARLIMVADDRVDLVHEALLEKWPQLRQWVNESRRYLERRDELRIAALAWQTAECPDDGLPRGVQLAYFLSAPAEDDATKAFLNAAVRAEQQRRAEGTRAFRRRVLALSTTLALSLALAAWALLERAEANEQRRIAEQRRAEAKEVADRLVHDLDDQLARVPGTIGARAALLDTAGDLLDRLNGDDGASSAVIASRVESHRKRARLASRYEAHDLAVRELLEAERLGRRRVALNPESVDAKLDLTLTLRELHWHDRSALDFQRARRRNADARALLVPFVEAHPDNVKARRILVDVLGDQQSLAEGIGPLAEASEATDLYERFVTPLLQPGSPTDEDLMRLVRMHVGRSALASKTGDAEAAFAHLDRARAADGLRGPAEEPGDQIERQTWLDFRDGEFALAARRFDRAQRSLARVVQGLEELLRDQPSAPRSTQLRLVVARCWMAEAMLHANEVSAAEIQLSLALEAMDTQLKLDPANPRFSYYFGLVHLGRARLRLATHVPLEALSAAELAVEFFRSRWRMSGDIDNAISLVDALVTKAMAQVAANDNAAGTSTLIEVWNIIGRFDRWDALARAKALKQQATELSNEIERIVRR